MGREWLNFGFGISCQQIWVKWALVEGVITQETTTHRLSGGIVLGLFVRCPYFILSKWRFGRLMGGILGVEGDEILRNHKLVLIKDI